MGDSKELVTSAMIAYHFQNPEDTELHEVD
jgi:hypothetical protein